MKKNIVYFAVILVIAIGLVSGCAPKPSQSQPSLPAKVSEPPIQANTSTAAQPTQTAAPGIPDEWAGVDPGEQQITFLHIFGGGREQTLATLAGEFNATNLYGINVYVVNEGSYVDIYNKMLGAIGTTEVPDLLVAFQNQAAEYRLKDGLLDLTSLVDSPTWGISQSEREVFFPSIWSQDIYPTLAGQRLGIPFYRSMDLLYYNLDWLKALGYDAPPTTPDEFEKMACASVQAPFNPDAGGRTNGTIFFADASRLASWVFAFGGDIYNYGQHKFTLNADIVKGTLAYQRKLIASGCAIESTSSTFDQEQFIQSKALFIMGSSSLIPYFTEAVQKGDIKFQWGAAPFPRLTPEPVSNTYGASLSIGKSTPERELAAFIFLKYLISAESQAHWAQTAGVLPVRSDAQVLLSQWFAANPAYKTAFDLLAAGKSEPPLPGYDFVRKEIEDSIGAILEGGDVNTILEILNEKADILVESQAGK